MRPYKMSEFDEKIKKFKKIEKKVLAFLGNLCYTKQVPNARVQKKHKKLIWLRGQAVKTLASHAGIRGSIPLGVTKIHRLFCGFFCRIRDETKSEEYSPGKDILQKY